MIFTSAKPRSRSPAVAGSFYPRSAATLSSTVGGLLSAGTGEERVRRCGIIAPHAGYAYSGAVAAEAFASIGRLKGQIMRAVIIGPAHYVPFRGIAAPSDAAFTTPLGEVPVDTAAIEALREEAVVTIDDEPHAPEHALEVELPFLQAIFGDLPIVPLIVGSSPWRAGAAAVARQA